MSKEIEMDSVNHHYLEKVMDLAEEMDVEATEDIYDSRGMKLVAKGARISRSLQEKLILHKLKKPLESSIAVEGGVNIEAIVTEAKRVLETIPAIEYLLKTVNTKGQKPLDILTKLQFGNAIGMMLTIIERGGSSALTHCVIVSLISTCFAQKLGLDETDQIVVALAGLMHDIGELYIEPAYLDRSRRLQPHEWRHIIAHPRIGQMLIGELEQFPPAVALAVYEHHERFNGSGYPRQVAGKNISPAGQVLSVAETIADILTVPDRPLECAEFALKIIPGEHAYELVSAISSALHLMPQSPTTESQVSLEQIRKTMQNLFDQISSIKKTGAVLIEQANITSKKAKELLWKVSSHTDTIQRALISTGLDEGMLEEAMLLDASNEDLMFKIAMIVNEIQQRLRDVARNLALHSSGLEEVEQTSFLPLIKMLDEGQQ